MVKVNVMAIEEQAYQNSNMEDGRSRRLWWLAVPVLAAASSIATLIWVFIEVIVKLTTAMEGDFGITIASVVTIPMLCVLLFFFICFMGRSYFYPKLGHFTISSPSFS